MLAHYRVCVGREAVAADVSVLAQLTIWAPRAMRRNLIAYSAIRGDGFRPGCAGSDRAADRRSATGDSARCGPVLACGAAASSGWRDAAPSS